ncbi:conserved hypothetical protein [Flavobacteria bacterium BBFL7]|nr:conserved hypothetical protein [Flavobacteria bacterium BBFL7]
MAKPRIFISSTFFDLRQVRADLDRFIKEMGYESVRNETGAIPYGKDLKLEDYCYKEISGIDILVGIIGGRFGSKSSSGDYSVTQTEIKTALEQNKNVYLFIDKNVHSEYETYLINKDNSKTKYRYADDVRIYKFIEEIYGLPKNNVIHSFETAQDIINFLREQWAGLVKDLLSQTQKRSEYENISSKVNELNEVSDTLKTYLENVLESVNGAHSSEIILKEKQRLQEFQLKQKLSKNSYINHLTMIHDVTLEQVILALKESKKFLEFKEKISSFSEMNTGEEDNINCLIDYDSLHSVNQAREILNLKEFILTKKESKILDEEYEQMESFHDFEDITEDDVIDFTDGE